MLFHRKIITPQQKPRIISIHTAGLCDRLNGLITTTYLAEQLHRQIHLQWHPELANYCKWHDLFETPQYPQHTPKTNNKIHIGLCFPNSPRNYRQWTLQDYQKIPTNTTIIHWSPFLDNIIPHAERCRIAKTFTPKPKILKKINTLKQQFNINKTVIGIQARETDKQQDPTYNPHRIHNIITNTLQNNPHQRILLCSDSQETEHYFTQQYPHNIITRPKTYPTCKPPYKPGTANRSLESVIDALIDLHLLAATTYIPIPQPHSHFNQYVPFLQ
jgi:hypothetical protein